MQEDQPAPISAAINPFAAALREGAALTYLAMLDAGLAAQFDPLPTEPSGLGLLSAMLSESGQLGIEVCKRWMKMGVDATAAQRKPDWGAQGQAWNAASQCMDVHGEGADLPLATLAIGARREAFAPLWRSLPADKLRSISPSALPLAVQTDNLEALGALLAAGADPNLRGETNAPVSLLAQTPEALRLLLDAGADLRERAPGGRFLNGRLVPEGGRAAHESILGGTSHEAKDRAMRELALAWLKAHPPADDPDSDLAAAAFDAVERGSRDARKRVEILGARAIERRDAAGDTLAIRCAVRKNFVEAARLIKLGADPFEVAPSGRSLLGELSRSLETYGSNVWQSAERAQRDRCSKLLASIQAGRRGARAEIPWTRRSASGATLLESLLGTSPLVEFLGRSESAEAAGLDPRSPLSDGMDLSCRLALHLALESPWTGRYPPSAATRASTLVMDYLELHPLSACGQSALAAFARVFARTCQTQTLDGAQWPASYSAQRTLDPDSPWSDHVARSFEAWGAEDPGAPNFDVLLGAWPEGLRERARSLFERGHLRAESEPVTQGACAPATPSRRL